MKLSQRSVTDPSHVVRRTRWFGVVGMIAAVLLAVVGVIVGEGSASASTRSLERIGMLLPVTVYTCWWVFAGLSSMRTEAYRKHASTTAADAEALEALFNAADNASADLPEPALAGRPILTQIDDEVRASYKNSVTRPVSNVPGEMRPGFRSAG